jgi:hypothetical protein
VRNCSDLSLDIKQLTMQRVIPFRSEVGQFGQSLAKVVLAPEKIKRKRRRAQH